MQLVKQKQGFTLIELLVVIAIIAILAAILFPVFMSAKRKSQETKCLSNSRQIGQAILLYADDNDGGGPHENWWGSLDGGGVDPYASGQTNIMNGPLWKYLKSGNAGSSILRCTAAMKNSAGRLPKYSLVFNAYLTRSIFGQYNPGLVPNFKGGLDYGSIKFGLISEPAKLPMVIDDNTDPTIYPLVNDTNFCYVDKTTHVHGGYATITYLDGHSGRLPGGLQFDNAMYKNGKRIFCPVPP